MITPMRQGTRERSRAVQAVAALALLATLSLALGPSSASSESEIVIHGPDSSSHLRLTVRGDAVVVEGYLNRRGQVGCTEGQHDVICPLAGVGGIEIDMGPSDDKVEVLDPLPVPVTAHLGAGSDKFIGNAEPDTCYPEATKRNRCYGGAGNDVCITGNQNSDCVGDGGNDYCRTGAGSDGCWGDFSPKPDDPRQGKPGNDVCYMGPGEDGCHGGPGNDRLYGGPGADQLYGEAGHDYCDGGPGVGRSHGCEAGPGH
jgi:RTX calcium-binding nonapeptide repeat (4 copies)